MLRRCESCAVDIDEALLAELKEWRLKVSRELNVPAYVVFTDNTLIAIARAARRRCRAHGHPGIGARTNWSSSGADVLELVRSRG